MWICRKSLLYDLVNKMNILIPGGQSDGFTNVPESLAEVHGDISEGSKQGGPCDVCLSIFPGSEA